MVAYEELTAILFYILPGYIILYIVDVFTNYLHEKDIFERVIHYILFSLVAYTFGFFTLFTSKLFFGQLSMLPFDINQFIAFNKASLIILAFAYSLPFGYLFGNYYFNFGFPYRHFNTSKKYVPSAYADLEKKYKSGAWLTFHLKDGSIIQGSYVQSDRDEDERDYTFVIKDAKLYYPLQKKEVKLKGEKIIINAKEALLIQYNR